MAEHGFEEFLAPNLYFDRHHNSGTARILPGEYYATARDMLLVTVPGSCVCACIRDKASGIGCMNYFMPPDSGQDQDNPLGESVRYGTYAMEILINQLLGMGAKHSNFGVKVFGGSAVLRGFTVADAGECNAEFVLKFLKAEKFPLLRRICSIFTRTKYITSPKPDWSG